MDIVQFAVNCTVKSSFSHEPVIKPKPKTKPKVSRVFYISIFSRCVSRNSAGEVSRTLRLRVRPSPDWTARAEPDLQVADLGKNARIKCTVSPGGEGNEGED